LAFIKLSIILFTLTFNAETGLRRYADAPKSSPPFTIPGLIVINSTPKEAPVRKRFDPKVFCIMP
jgi:hypothetical protein